MPIVEERRNAYRKLITRDGRLVGAMLVGNMAAAASLLQLYDREDVLPADPLEVLCQGGSGGMSSERLICNCHKLTDRVLCEAIAAGADSIERVAEVTKAGTGCGSCKAEIGQLITSLKKPTTTLEVAS